MKDKLLGQKCCFVVKAYTWQLWLMCGYTNLEPNELIFQVARIRSRHQPIDASRISLLKKPLTIYITLPLKLAFEGTYFIILLLVLLGWKKYL